MANTYRAPTPEETQAYLTRLDDELTGLIGSGLIAAKTQAVLEGVFGPCTYSWLGPGKSRVTQTTPNEEGVQVQFEISADLSN